MFSGLPPRQEVVVQALARCCVRQRTNALCPRKLLERTMLFSLLGSAREQDLGRPEALPTKRLLDRINSVAGGLLELVKQIARKSLTEISETLVMSASLWPVAESKHTIDCDGLDLLPLIDKVRIFLACKPAWSIMDNKLFQWRSERLKRDGYEVKVSVELECENVLEVSEASSIIAWISFDGNAVML